jgi:uncharacterized protein with GYD domain
MPVGRECSKRYGSSSAVRVSGQKMYRPTIIHNSDGYGCDVRPITMGGGGTKKGARPRFPVLWRYRMSTYILLSKLSHDACTDPKDLPKVARGVTDRIKAECPNVNWKQSFATTGRFDVVDIVESPDLAGVERAAMIIRSYGHATTETLVATPWEDFLKSLSAERAAAGRG